MSALAETLPLWCRPVAAEATTGGRPMRLFCFPYAGGNANFFRPWTATLGRRAEVVAVQYPGHGHRATSPVPASMGELVGALAGELSPLFDRPCAFFGHSLGAWVAYELAVRLEREGLPGPSHVFLSSARPPPAPAAPRATVADLGDDAAVVSLARLIAPADRALGEAFLRDDAVPLLRADMKIVLGYAPAGPSALACPLTVFGAWNDPLVPVDSLRGWSAHSRASTRCVIVDGDHFYLRSRRELLCREILSDWETVR